jgi:hypothetical protein
MNCMHGGLISLQRYDLVKKIFVIRSLKTLNCPKRSEDNKMLKNKESFRIIL